MDGMRVSSTGFTSSTSTRTARSTRVRSIPASACNDSCRRGTPRIATDVRPAARVLWDHASRHAVGRDPDRSATLAHMRRLGHHLPSVALVGALLLLPRPGHTNGGDLPPQILLQGFVKPEGDRLHLVVRIPLILLQNLNLPKRGPGYLDLVRIEKWLNEAAAATGRDIELFEDGDRLVPARSAAQISLPSDRSFDGYASAAAHIAVRRLPVSTDVFWNQGYFDAHLEYPIRSAPADFAIHMKVEPGLGQRIKLRVQYLPVSGVSRT